jgi:general L-amino acid transport system permease protein
MTALALQAPLRLWYDARRRRQILQALLLAVVLVLGFYFWSNATTNIMRRGLELGFGFLDRSANFAIGETYIPYTPRDSYGRALLAGAVNTIIVAAIGCVLTTIFGIAFGIMRLSSNPLLPRVVGAYVEIGRNVPLLLQLFFWYSLISTLGGPRQAFSPLPGVFLSNRGLRLPGLVPNDAALGLVIGIVMAAASFVAAKIWADRRQCMTGRRPPVGLIALAGFGLWPTIGVIASGDSLQAEIPELRGFNFIGGMELSPEFFALLIGLTLYTTAFVTEIVRSGIQAVPKGQWEAGRAVGLSYGRIMRLIVLPQALRVIIPPLTSQYLNLTKNSSLAIAIGYPDLISVASTTINQTGQALEVIFVFMAIYLSLSLMISAGMNWLNARVAEPKR